jgi:predicted permease
MRSRGRGNRWIIFKWTSRFAFLAAICVLTGVLFGLAPALQVTKTNVNDVLKEGGRGNAGGRRARWLTGTMVVLELALTLVLLVGAGLMVGASSSLHARPRHPTDHLMMMRMQLPETKHPTAETRRAFYDRLAPRLAALPGAESVSLTTSVPPGGAGRRGSSSRGARCASPRRAPDVTVVTISPAFFETVGVQLPRPDFPETDGAPGAETVIINDQLAAQFFARRSDRPPDSLRARPGEGGIFPVPVWRTIVGISPSIRHSNPQEATMPAVVYLPYRQDPPQGIALLVRSRLDPGSVMNAVRREVQAVDQDQPVFTVQTMEQLISRSMWPYRVFGSLFAIFAIIALVMSAVGLYAVMAYSVTQRTSEIGVRMALGAKGSQVSWLILKRGLWQLGLGLGIGLAGASVLSQVMQSLLVQTEARDPVTFASITVILASVAIAACVIRAARHARRPVAVALRGVAAS